MGKRRWLFWVGLVLFGLLLGTGGTAGVLALAGHGPDRSGGHGGREAAILPDLIHAETARLPAEDSATPEAVDLPSTQPEPAATPAPDAEPKSLFDTSQVVSFYGHPLSAGLGALGDGTEEQMLARLKQQAAAYQAINTDKVVVPAIHLIYEVAQQFTLDDGLYLYRTDDATVEHYIKLTRDQHMLLFLDLQIGRSSLAAELLKVLPYLREPQVHLAIDPEFVTPPGMRPGQDIGMLDCLSINAALHTIEELAERYHLPNKIVVVHQFHDYMLKHKDQLDFSQPRVDVVLDMDGYGDQGGKVKNYDIFVKQFGAKYAGIKLFYKHDVGLLSERQVEGLDPRPNIVIYQ